MLLDTSQSHREAVPPSLARDQGRKEKRAISVNISLFLLPEGVLEIIWLVLFAPSHHQFPSSACKQGTEI